MKIRTILLTMTFMMAVALGYSQKKETVKNGKVNHQMTISESGMYGGTKSIKASDYFTQASRYGSEEKFDKAKEFYLKAIKEDSKYVEAYDNLGLVYRRTGELDKAIEYYKKSIELFPEGILAHQNLAAVYVINKDFDGAIAEYKQILKISPEDPEGYFGMANSLMMSSQFDEALINAEKALELYKQSNSHHIGDGYYMMGLINYYKGDDVTAKKYVLKAKENGAKIHPKIESELLNETVSNEADGGEEFRLETAEDYAKYEQLVINGHNWLLNTPVEQEVAKRKEINGFLVQWISGSPSVSVEITESIVTYLGCPDCLMMFMSGWTAKALESGDFDNKFEGNLAGTESVIAFYKSNKKVLGKNKAIEKLAKLKEKGKLKDFIRENM